MVTENSKINRYYTEEDETFEGSSVTFPDDAIFLDSDADVSKNSALGSILYRRSIGNNISTTIGSNIFRQYNLMYDVCYGAKHFSGIPQCFVDCDLLQLP